MRLLFTFLFIVLPCVGQAQRVRDRSPSFNFTISEGPRSGIVFHDLRSPSSGPSACFPYDCRGIITGIKNNNPRASSDIPACYYDAAGTLFFQRADAECAYKRSFGDIFSRDGSGQ